MGFFNINTILYTFRKVSKYLLLSLIVIAFIVVCLLLMNSSSFAYDSITYNAKRGYDDEDALYDDKFNVNYTINSNGTITINGTMDNISSMNYTFDVDFYDTNYKYIPLAAHDYNTRHYFLFKVPRDATFYAYNSGNFNNGNSFNCSFYCDKAYEVYEKTWVTSSNAAETTYTCPYLSAYPLCLTFDTVTKDNVLYNPFNESLTPVIPDPEFLNYEDSSTYGNTLVNGEFENFVFKVYDDSSVFAILHDITDGQPSDIFTADSVNSSMINLKDVGTSFTGEFIFKYLTSIDNGVYTYTVPVTSFFGRYKNNRHYMLVLSYPTGYKQYDWTTNFSSDGITIQNENINTQIDNSINNLNNTQKEINDFLKDDSYDSSQIVDNMPNSDEYSAPTDTGINTLFTSLYNAFTRDSAEPVRFYLPFVDGAYIDIPADIVSSHLPSPIIFLIQTFYWYLICRYIIKDIAGIAQKAKSGEILDASTDNIKTELL